MAQSKEDIAKALAALAGGEVAPSESPPPATPGAPVKQPESPKSDSNPKSNPSANPTTSSKPEPSQRPSRPDAPSARPTSPQAPVQQVKPPQPKVAPMPQISTSGRPERPTRPVRPSSPAIQSSSEPDSVDFVPSTPSFKSFTATDEIRLRSLRSTLALRQLFIPTCMVLGITLPLLAIVWFVLKASELPMVVLKLPIWAVALVALAGLFFAGLSVLFMLSTKALNQNISELDDKARTA